jgi:alanine racemase
MIGQPNRVTIDLSALIHNLKQIRGLIPGRTRIMGVVKSDAYGHGLLPVSRALDENGVDCLGVAYLHEASSLRDGGIGLPIVILSGIWGDDELREMVAKNLTPLLFDLDRAEALDRESARQGKKTGICLKIDTGMGRLGIPCQEVEPFIRRIMAFENLRILSLTSHLSSADENECAFTDGQVESFKKAIETARSMGMDLSLNSLANSAGTMTRRDASFEMVRPGIMLYGGLPSPHFKSPVPLKPVMHFKGRVLQTRDLPPNTPVSYGRTYCTDGPCCIAVLSAGYGDGLPRGMSNRGSVLIGGERVPIVGRICMNLTICDISGIKGVRPGDEAVFLGSQGSGSISGDDIAEWAGTISYEVFCSIGRANRKEYIL